MSPFFSGIDTVGSRAVYDTNDAKKKKKPENIYNMSKEIDSYNKKKHKKKKLKPLYDDDNLNSHLLNNFHEKTALQPRSNTTIKKIDENKTEYSVHNKPLLTMEKTKDGKFKATVTKNFTGTLIVYRKGANGQIDTSKADIIQYKKGKPVRVSSPAKGGGGYDS